MNYSLVGHQTERLVFRRVLASDFNDWLPLFDSPTAAKFLGMDITLSKKEHCQFWFDKCFERYENNRGFMNALVLKDSNILVGQCGILEQTIEDKAYIEVGYSVLPQYWGKGYASEAAIACKKEAFKRNLTDLVISHINVDNIGSISVAKKNGMKEIDRHIEKNGQEMFIYGITRKEWNANKDAGTS